MISRITTLTELGPTRIGNDAGEPPRFVELQESDALERLTCGGTTTAILLWLPALCARLVFGAAVWPTEEAKAGLVIFGTFNLASYLHEAIHDGARPRGQVWGTGKLRPRRGNG